jgi:hypothetical protein
MKQVNMGINDREIGHASLLALVLLRLNKSKVYVMNAINQENSDYDSWA